MKLTSLRDTFLIINTPSIEEVKRLTDTFFLTNTPSNKEAEEFDRHVLDHQYSLHWWNWRWSSPNCLHWRKWSVWQTRSSSPILPPLKKLKSLTDTITNTAFWRVWQTRSSSPILPPLKKHLADTFWSPILSPVMKLKSLAERSWSPILSTLN